MTFRRRAAARLSLSLATWSVLCVLAAGIGGCGSSGRGRRPGLPTDGGGPGDSGGPVDAGPAGDAGPPGDAGIGFDAGTIDIDAGSTGFDAGTITVDAGPGRPDSGPGFDAGPGRPDAGPGFDAGSTTSSRAACAAPGMVPATGGSVTVTLSTGSADGALGCGTATPGLDRAYTWTPSRTGTATLTAGGTDATGADFDTVLAVFSSASCDPLTELACDDDSGAGLGSLLSLAVTAGTRYYIVVESYTDPTPAGSVTLTVTLP